MEKNKQITNLKLGQKFKFGRTDYEVVATFIDDGHEYYVAKINKEHYGSYIYANIFTFSESNVLYKHV